MKILIGADLVPTRDTEKYFINRDVQSMIGRISNIVKNCDRFAVNLECALTECNTPIKKFGPNIKASPECVNGLLAMGVTDVFLSNNHVLDFGVEGLLDTEKTLSDAGLPYTGVGANDTDSREPYFIEKNGKIVGFVNICEHEYTYALPNRPGTNPFDPFETMHDIRMAKARCNYLIVIYHGGKEHCQYPSPRLVNMAHEMARCGANAVIMQHSHCVGCYERFEGCHIVYGQGNFNFVFNEYSDRPSTWHNALLTEIDTDTSDISFYPIVETETGCDLAMGKDAADIMTPFLERNKSMLDGSWRDGWHEFCVSPGREYYHNSIVNPCVTEEEKERFAHYLDCEAHTDVWRELYKTWNHTNR